MQRLCWVEGKREGAGRGFGMRYGVGGSEMRDRVGGGGGGERVRDERRSRMGRGRGEDPG